MTGMQGNLGGSQEEVVGQTEDQGDCPYCRSGHVVLNGVPLDRQVYLCRGCGKKWREGGAIGGRHYSPDQIGSAIQTVYTGLSFRKAAARVQEMWSIRDAEIAPQTVRHWVLRYTDAAMASLRETKVPSCGRWSLWGIKGGYFQSAWFMVDTDTGYILSCQLQPSRNEGSPRAAVLKALASSDCLPVSVAHCGFWTIQGSPARVGSESLALGMIREELSEATGIQLQESIDTGGGGTTPMVEELVAAFCRAIPRFDRVLNWGSLYIYINGWVITRNLFTYSEGLGGRTPAQVAGVTAPFASWADVVRMEAQANILTPDPETC